MTETDVSLPIAFDLASLRTRLRPKEALFVARYLGGMSGVDAVRAAGYVATTDGSARVKAHKLIHRNPRVKAALEEAKAELARRNDYNLDKALFEIDTDLRGARRADQWTAVANLQRTKQQMVGHLDERPVINMAPFQIIVEGLS